jgi:thiamine kinase
VPEEPHKIQSIIERIPCFEGARPVQLLIGGETSVKWLLEAGNDRFVLRVDRAIVGERGLDRQAETEILEVVGVAGIGPRLVWASPTEGIQLCAYVEGDPWSRSDCRNPALLSSLARTLAHLHGLPASGPAFDPAGAAKCYAAEIATSEADELAFRAIKVVDELSEESGRSALCHNDLVHTNLVGHGPVRLIDWEFAAVGDPCFDLAIVIRHHELSGPLIEVFLDEYARLAGPVSSQRLSKNFELYDLLAVLWYESLVHKSGPSSPIRAEWQRAMLRLNENRPNSPASGF